MEIHFQFQVSKQKLNNDDDLLLLGNVPELGEWKYIASEQKLIRNRDSNTFQTAIKLNSRSQIQFKLVIKRNDSENLEWEQFENSQLENRVYNIMHDKVKLIGEWGIKDYTETVIDQEQLETSPIQNDVISRNINQIESIQDQNQMRGKIDLEPDFYQPIIIGDNEILKLDIDRNEQSIATRFSLIDPTEQDSQQQQILIKPEEGRHRIQNEEDDANKIETDEFWNSSIGSKLFKQIIGLNGQTKDIPFEQQIPFHKEIIANLFAMHFQNSDEEQMNLNNNDEHLNNNSTDPENSSVMQNLSCLYMRLDQTISPQSSNAEQINALQKKLLTCKAKLLREEQKDAAQKEARRLIDQQAQAHETMLINEKERFQQWKSLTSKLEGLEQANQLHVQQLQESEAQFSFIIEDYADTVEAGYLQEGQKVAFRESILKQQNDNNAKNQQISALQQRTKDLLLVRGSELLHKEQSLALQSQKGKQLKKEKEDTEEALRVLKSKLDSSQRDVINERSAQLKQDKQDKKLQAERQDQLRKEWDAIAVQQALLKRDQLSLTKSKSQLIQVISSKSNTKLHKELLPASGETTGQQDNTSDNINILKVQQELSVKQENAIKSNIGQGSTVKQDRTIKPPLLQAKLQCRLMEGETNKLDNDIQQYQKELAIKKNNYQTQCRIGFAKLIFVFFFFFFLTDIFAWLNA